MDRAFQPTRCLLRAVSPTVAMRGRRKWLPLIARSELGDLGVCPCPRVLFEGRVLCCMPWSGQSRKDKQSTTREVLSCH